MFKFILLVSLIYTFAFASDDDSDILESFDFENTSFINVFNNSTIDDKDYDKYEFLNILNINNKTDLSDDIQLDTSILLLYTTANNNQKGVITPPNNNDNDIRYIDISKLYLTYFSDEFDLFFGKKAKTIGLSEIYSPTDLFTKSVVSSPQHPTEMGSLMIGIDYYLDDDTISFNIFPTNTNYGIPDMDSRWLQGGDIDFYVLDINDSNLDTSTIEYEENDSKLKNWTFLLQYSGVIDGTDYYGYICRKKSIYPVLDKKSNLSYMKIYPVSFYAAAGLLKIVKENKFYFDAVYQDTLNDLDQDFIKYNIGMKHRETEYASNLKLDEIALILEYSGELITNEDLATEVYQNSENARINKNNITFTTQFIKDSYSSFSYLINYSTENEDSVQNLNFKYNFNDNQTLYLSYYIYSGAEDTHFGRWSKNDNAEVGFKYKF